MKSTIEERAKEYALRDFPGRNTIKEDILELTESAAEAGYIVGATAQKAIDDAEWLKIKSSWEREAQINHNDEANYQQGFHDAIEKAILWLKARSEYPFNKLQDSFITFMEE